LGAEQNVAYDKELIVLLLLDLLDLLYELMQLAPSSASISSRCWVALICCSRMRMFRFSSSNCR
jgi:hypothetical protein